MSKPLGSYLPRCMSLCLAISTPSLAEQQLELRIKDRVFLPSELVARAGEPITLVVINQDQTPEEFESQVLNREKLLPPGSRTLIRLPALQPGAYPFMGEFHPQSLQGVLRVTAAEES